jgi:hypothetical protein
MVGSKLNLPPSNLQLMPWNLQIQYSYLLNSMYICTIYTRLDTCLMSIFRFSLRDKVTLLELYFYNIVQWYVGLLNCLWSICLLIIILSFHFHPLSHFNLSEANLGDVWSYDFAPLWDPHVSGIFQNDHRCHGNQLNA